MFLDVSWRRQARANVSSPQEQVLRANRGRKVRDRGREG